MMKSFKEFLEEQRSQEIVHHNPSMSTLKAIARNNRYGSARFVITKPFHDGEKPSLHAGDSEKFTHQDVQPAMGSWHLRGYVNHSGGKYSYRTMGPNDNLPKDHPMLRRFEKHGIEAQK